MALNKVHQQKIEQLLIRIGLNQSERNVYLIALFLGPSSIIQLAAKAGYKRVTTHAIVDKLLQSGLFLDTYRGKKRLVYPNTIDALYALLEQKKFELEQLESQIKSTEHIFTQIKTLSENFPGVRMFQGIDGINTMLTETAKDGKEIYVINDAHSFNTLIDERLLQRSYKKRKESGVQTKMIYPKGFEDFRHVKRDESYDVHIKMLPKEQIVDGGISIRGSKISLHCHKEGFVTTTIIENAQIASIMKIMFQAMRGQAQDYQGSYVVI